MEGTRAAEKTPFMPQKPLETLSGIHATGCCRGIGVKRRRCRRRLDDAMQYALFIHRKEWILNSLR